MQIAQLPQLACAVAGQLDMDLAAVFGILFAFHPTRFFGAIHQTDDAVMPQLEKLGEIAHRRPPFTRKACDAKQELMLLRRQSDAAGLGIGAAEHFAHGVTEAGEVTRI